MRLFLTAAVAALAAGQQAAALVFLPSGPGPAACASLSSSLGSGKVNQNHLSPAFLESQTGYYNKEFASNVPACVVEPTQTSDVSTALKIIKASNSTFAIK